MEITSAQIIGGRPYQEDRMSVIIDTPNVLVSVFDGHSGSGCVELLQKHIFLFYQLYTLECQNLPGKEILKRIYSDLNTLTKDCEDGSTASSALITPEGVSLAVLGDSPIQVLTPSGPYVMPEHNVRTNYDESLSAMSRGGVISSGYLYTPGFGKGLQMSRSFGDKEMGDIILRTPQITTLDNVQSILVATDGLTDPGHFEAPFLLTKESTAQELVERYKNSFDNVTAIVVHLT